MRLSRFLSKRKIGQIKKETLGKTEIVIQRVEWFDLIIIITMQALF